MRKNLIRDCTSKNRRNSTVNNYWETRVLISRVGLKKLYGYVRCLGRQACPIIILQGIRGARMLEKIAGIFLKNDGEF
jgi:hypothetical protein